MKQLFGLLLIIAIHTSANSQTFNRPAPTAIGQYEFQRFDMIMQNKYYLFAPFTFSGQNTNTFPTLLYIIDEDGYIAWWSEYSKKQFDFKYHPSSDQYTFTRRDENNSGIFHYRMDNAFNIVDSISSVNGATGDIHEFQVFPNGNRCILATKDSVMDLSSTLINGVFGSANTTVVSMIVQEFDPAGTLVFEWSSLDYLGPELYGPGLFINTSSFDYMHSNSIERDLDDNLILSMRGANLVVKIDHTTGNVIWKLGGNTSDFTFTNDPGFTGQHDARILDNGNISIFDNNFPTNSDARGIEYELDTVNFTATAVNESNYTFDFAARSLGSYRVLDNEYRLVGWGNTKRPSPSVTLYDPQGDIAADFFMKDTVVTYRAFFQDLPSLPTRPEIDCQTIGSELELSLSGTHNAYLWSTGETTATILIDQPGTYQCWVDQGIGMLGSFTATLTDLTSCSEVGIGEANLTPKEIAGYFDIMGRKLNKTTLNEIYFIQFEDGSIVRQLNVLFE